MLARITMRQRQQQGRSRRASCLRLEHTLSWQLLVMLRLNCAQPLTLYVMRCSPSSVIPSSQAAAAATELLLHLVYARRRLRLFDLRRRP